MESDYDGAWKDLLHRRLREVLECFFPKVAEAIEWKHQPEYLEQELRELVVGDEAKANRVDLLVKVQMHDGCSQILYLHIEIQSFEEREFSKRVALCNYRLRAAIGEDVISLVILADLNPRWKPEEYRHERLGCEIVFRFPCCKLLEILPRIENDCSFPALAARAQIEALQTSAHPDKRLAARWKLTRKLYEVGWKKEEIYEAFRLLSWMMKLPDTEYLIYKKKVITYEKEKLMHTAPLLDFEIYAMKEGLKKGLKQGRQEGLKEGQQKMILELLELRFGDVPKGLAEAVRAIHKTRPLEDLFRTAATCASMEGFSEQL